MKIKKLFRLSMMLNIIFLEYVAKGVDKATQKPHFIEQMVPFVFIFLLFYLLLIRPAQKRQKNHQQLISSLKTGDKVVTTSGILGTIYSLTDEVVTLEVAENVKIQMVRSQVSAIRSDEHTSKRTSNTPLKHKQIK